MTARSLGTFSLASSVVVAATLTTQLATAAMAEDTRAEPWTFTVTPYVWFTSLEGDVATIRGIPPADVDASFGDIWDNLDFTFMGNLQAQRGRWGFSADLIYMDLSADGDGPTNAFSKSELDFKAFIGTFAPFYRAVEEEAFTLDALAGARVWVTDTDLTLKAGALPGRSNSEKETWADPIVGMRTAFAATEKLSVNGYFDLGGFGVASDITYQLLTTVGYAFTDSITAEIGYRYLKVDYEDDGFILNAEFQGPIAGVRIRF